MSDPTQHPINKRRYEASKALRIARDNAADYIEAGQFERDESHATADRLQQALFDARDEMETAQSAYDQFLAEKHG